MPLYFLFSSSSSSKTKKSFPSLNPVASLRTSSSPLLNDRGRARSRDVPRSPSACFAIWSYIVYLGEHSHGIKPTSYDLERATDSHYELLGSFLGSKERAKDAIFYSYTRHINGFAANLEENEAWEIANHSNVISVFPNTGRELQTTRSWKFLGLEKVGRVPMNSLWTKTRFGENIIIGSVDTGVWPESVSFNDDGLGPVPAKWRGICQNSTIDGVQCNRKLIGMRYFKEGYEANKPRLARSLTTARDFQGHGTHTLSTAAGRFIHGVSFLGQGNGTAKGGAPNARVAAYKVCWDPARGNSCYDADLIAAFDAAIHDGVDVISTSLGGSTAKYFNDAIAIGAFHAMKCGIPVICPGGNSGKVGAVANTAPWVITVAASTIDREFSSYVILGDKRMLKGQSFSTSELPEEKQYPLIKGSDAKFPNAEEVEAQYCFPGSLDPQKVEGNIVVCQRGGMGRVEQGHAVLEASGVGMILVNEKLMGNRTSLDLHVLPATHLSAFDGVIINNYIDATRSPTAYITPTKTELNAKPAPIMAPFCSQGPNAIVPEILKPDITAPGVNIIAAMGQDQSNPELPFHSSRFLFDMDSGTSMSCPHIAAIAGLLRAVHPKWSPAAIKSAIMTTAYVRDNTRRAIKSSSFEKANPFNFGGGHVRPNRAMDPGLVYDLTPKDYLDFLCSLDYTPSELKKIASIPYSCPKKPLYALNFNYPSITIPNLIGFTNVTRVLKNVGSPGTYIARVREPDGVSVLVKPERLSFESAGDVKEFMLIVKAKDGVVGSGYVFGRLKWTDGVHNVRSPIVVRVLGVENVVNS